MQALGLRLASRSLRTPRLQSLQSRSLYAAENPTIKKQQAFQHKSGYVHTKQPGYNVYFPILMGWQAFLVVTVLGGLGSLALGSKEGMAWLPLGSKKVRCRKVPAELTIIGGVTCNTALRHQLLVRWLASLCPSSSTAHDAVSLESVLDRCGLCLYSINMTSQRRSSRLEFLLAALKPGARYWRPEMEGGSLWAQHSPNPYHVAAQQEEAARQVEQYMAQVQDQAEAAEFETALSGKEAKPPTTASLKQAIADGHDPGQVQWTAMRGAQQAATNLQEQISANTDPPDRPGEGRSNLEMLCATAPCHMPIGRYYFPSVAHFVACARLDVREQPQVLSWLMSLEPIQAMAGADQAAQVSERRDWDDQKAIESMRAAVALRHALYPQLNELLLKTGHAQIWETSNLRDGFWGVGDGAGQNWYGRILMDLRSRLQLERANGYTDVVSTILSLLPPDPQYFQQQREADNEDDDQIEDQRERRPNERQVRFEDAPQQ